MHTTLKERMAGTRLKDYYWNTHKLGHFVLSYVLSVTQQYEQSTARKASLLSIQPLWKIWRNILVKCMSHISIPESHTTAKFQQCQTRFIT